MRDSLDTSQPIYRLLGPIVAHGESGTLSAGAPKLLSVLAILLLHANQVVTEDRLSALVWGEQQPPSAMGRLRVYISELRAVLGHHRLLRRGGGYQMRVTAGELDLQMFTDAVSSARVELRAGRADSAAQQLRGALSLWTGQALGGVTVDLAAQERPSLEERRMSALEDLFDAELTVGRHDQIIAELRLACADHPFRERLVAQLMTALHRAGRTADALDLYTTTRRRLLDELGISPGHALQQTQLDVLNTTGTPQRSASLQARAAPNAPNGSTIKHAATHDEGGGRTASSPTTSFQRPCAAPYPPPRLPGPSLSGNLPHRVSTLVGRDSEINQAVAAVREEPFVTLTGVGGVGKTRLALEVAKLEQNHFRDGVWLCELAVLPRNGSVARCLAETLRIRQRPDQPIEQTLLDYLRSRHLLVVLDNCEHVLADAARLVDQIVSRCPRIVVLATSRAAFAVDDERVCVVPPLSEEDGARLFAQRARAACPSFELDEQAKSSVAEICRRLDGVPLAIELAAARIPVLNVAEVAERLEDRRLLMRRSRTTQLRHQSLQATLDWSYQLLSHAERRLFDRMSIFAGGTDGAVIHAVCAEPEQLESEILDLLAALTAKSMVVAENDASGTRYRIQEILRAYGRDHLLARDSLAERHAKHFVDLAEQAARGLQGDDERAWVNRTLPEANNLRAAFEWAIANHNVDLAMRLTTSLPEIAQLRLGWETFGWVERALELASDDHPLYVAALGAAARNAWCLGDFSHARELATRAADRKPARGTARSAYPADVAADVLLHQGNIQAALDHYISQADLARRADDSIRLVVALQMIAVCQAARRTPQLGLAAAEEAIQVSERTNNPSAISMAHYALGLVLKKSDPTRALAEFDLAAALAASVHNRWGQGVAEMEAGVTRAVHDDPSIAAKTLSDVLDYWDRVGDRTQLWLALRYVVRLLVRLGAERDAVVLHRCLLNAGQPSPLDASRVSQLAENLGPSNFSVATTLGSKLSVANAVAHARSCLHRMN